MFEKLRLLNDEELANYSKDGYCKFKITLQGFYGWGTGYYNDDACDDFNAVTRGYVRRFAESYTDGVRFSYKYNQSSCDEILPLAGNNPTSAYLHPMDFTGYGKQDFIDGLVSSVQNGLKVLGAEDKYKITGIRQMLVPFIPEREYEEIIISHSAEIIEEVRQSREFKKLDTASMAHYAADEFMRHADIKRAGMEPGYSSSDRTYLTVKNIVMIADRLGTLNKTKTRSRDVKEMT